MSFLNPFLKGKKTEEARPNYASETVSIDILHKLIPIRSYSEEILQAFATDNKAEIYPKQTILFRINETTDSILYLLSGTIMLTDESGNHYEVVANTAKAKFPLSSGTIHTTTAIAKTEVSLLRVQQKIMVSKQSPLTELTKLNIPKEQSENHLLQLFSEHLEQEKLELPTLPDIAIKLRNAMLQDISLADAVKIIQLDPVITAKLIEVANCPLYLSPMPAKSCFTAVSRIGLNATRNLVIGLSINHIFKTNSPLIKKQLDNLWKQSLYISTLSHVLASVTKQANPEEALLAGLICDIGAVPFLNFTTKLPKEYYTEADLQNALPVVKGPIGCKVLLEWGFPDELTQVPYFSDDWYQNTSSELSLLDIVVLSRLHHKMSHADMNELPAMTSIPAASKLKNFALSPEYSLKVLFEAKHLINDALKVLAN
jgi:HD-like signal output (HDOD) protein